MTYTPAPLWVYRVPAASSVHLLLVLLILFSRSLPLDIEGLSPFLTEVESGGVFALFAKWFQRNKKRPVILTTPSVYHTSLCDLWVCNDSPGMV